MRRRGEEGWFGGVVRRGGGGSMLNKGAGLQGTCRCTGGGKCSLRVPSFVQERDAPEDATLQPKCSCSRGTPVDKNAQRGAFDIMVGQCPKTDRLVFYCRTPSSSTTPCTSRRTCCPACTHCASYCAPCQPLLRAFSGWIRSPPLTTPKT